MGVAVGPHTMTILILGEVAVGGAAPRQFAQQWIVTQGRNIVNMFNTFHKADDAMKPQFADNFHTMGLGP